ncbi:MAG: hypothetical protein LBJ12_00485 [Oscillospiraceae bacterium]|jgi:hypothetical protein|nr:hypothetical protein [Oscillospiraceae bacterium]
MKKQISAALFLIPTLLLIAAIALPTVFGIRAYQAFNSPKQEFELIDGKAKLTFIEVGTFELYYSAYFGLPFSTPSITVESTDGKAAATVNLWISNNSSFTVNGKTWNKVADINVSEAGTYTVTMLENSGTDKPSLMRGSFLAGQNVVSAPVAYTLIAVFGGVFLFIGAVIGFIVIAAVRANRKRQLAREGYAPQYASNPAAPEYRRYTTPPQQ